jgi:hypothetical protein
MIKHLDYADKVASAALVLAHKCLFEYQPSHVEDAIRVIEGVLQRYTRQKLGMQPAKAIIWLSPYVEMRLRWLIAWILKEFIQDANEASVIMAIQHLKRSVSEKETKNKMGI